MPANSKDRHTECEAKAKRRNHTAGDRSIFMNRQRVGLCSLCWHCGRARASFGRPGLRIRHNKHHASTCLANDHEVSSLNVRSAGGLMLFPRVLVHEWSGRGVPCLSPTQLCSRRHSAPVRQNFTLENRTRLPLLLIPS